ncbi:MAG: hypothetical protein LBC09_02775, partial [Helicobacteraceae bacterium]|nr:hypothetical protein [Helicobacteraceae bacterium]
MYLLHKSIERSAQTLPYLAVEAKDVVVPVKPIDIKSPAKIAASADQIAFTVAMNSFAPTEEHLRASKVKIALTDSDGNRTEEVTDMLALVK